MNTRFADHVTSLAFNLSLSKSMIIALAEIAEHGRGAIGRGYLRVMGLTDTTVPTRKRLEERGLIFAPDEKYPGVYELTEAGEHVVALLKIAGIYSNAIPNEVAA